LHGRCHLELEFETIASNGILERRSNKHMDVDKLATRDLDFKQTSIMKA
jgi:hypothetical protein